MGYFQVMREVINNQMLTYEDWLRDQLGIVGHTEPSEPENLTKNDKKIENKSEEMIWLDWSFRDNPYNWWKHLLEKEKRRIERGEIDKNGDKESKSENKGSDSRRSDPRNHNIEDKDRRRKYDYNHHDRYKDSKTFKSEKELCGSEWSYKNKDELNRYRESRHKEKRHEASEKDRYRSVNKHDSRESYKESKRKRSHRDQANESKIWEDSYNDHERQVLKVKRDQDSDNEHYRKKHKTNEFVKIKQESEEVRESDTDSKSNLSISSSQTKKSRRKKSKKKHGHKHKSKKKKNRERSSEKYNPMISDDSSQE